MIYNDDNKKDECVFFQLVSINQKRSKWREIYASGNLTIIRKYLLQWILSMDLI